MWLANLAALELHTHQWTMADPDHPTAMVLDLDPGEPATIVDCCRVALELHDTARTARLAVRREDVGRQGPAPVGAAASASGATDEETKRFALALGQLLEHARPEARHHRHDQGEAPGQGVRRLEPERPAQDDRVRLLAAPQDQPTVSTPLTWDEVADVEPIPTTCTFERPTCSDRVEEFGDLYADSLTLEQELPQL